MNQYVFETCGKIYDELLYSQDLEISSNIYKYILEEWSCLICGNLKTNLLV